MTITPHDIQNKEFREAFRGYNEDDVDTFLDGVAEEYGRVYAENQRLRIQLASLQQDAAQRGILIADPVSDSPDTIVPAGVPTGVPAGAPAGAPSTRAEERAEAREEMKRALVATQRAAEAALDEAKRRAAEIVVRAEQRAKEIDEMTARRAQSVDSGSAGVLTTLQERIAELRRQETELRSRLRRMLAEHVKMLQQLEGESIAATAPDSIGTPDGTADPGSTAAGQAADPNGPTATEPSPPPKRGTRWDTPRVKALPPDGPRPAGLASKPMGLRPDGPRSEPDPSARAAVVARMAKDLGDAALPPDRASMPTARDAFWRR